MKFRILFTTLIIFCFLGQSSAAVSLIMPHRSGNNGTQITIPVKVKDYLNIIGTQGTIDFNPAILSYVSTTVGSLGGISFGTTQVATGQLTFQWYDGTLAGVSLADSSTIFAITFNIIGSASQMSALAFTSTPTTIEIVNTSFATEAVTLVNGSVTVNSTVGIDNAPWHSSAQPLLLQNTPNPFSTGTSINFILPEDNTATITIFNIVGEKVFESSQWLYKGEHRLFWNAQDASGASLDNGIYFYRLQSGSFSATKKMNLTH